MSRETIFENKTTMVEALASQHPVRTDQTSDEAREYRKARLPGERKNPMDTQHVVTPRRGHGY
jgi:hypothetical protein